MPTPSVDPALASYSPLLVEAVSGYPSGLDFVGDGLSPDEKNVLDWADSRLFANPSFLASIYGPDKWPSEVRLASVQAVPLLMLAIDIQKNPDEKHVISWEVDSLDRILDELGIYEGVCVSCYGKSGYETIDEVRRNHYPIVNDPKHVHRELLKTFAYLAKADGGGILIGDFMENDVDDFGLLYQRDSNIIPVGTEFGWRNLSFMSQVKLPDGTVKSFPTQVYEIIGSAGSEREAAERWFGHLNEVMSHFTGGTEDFANLYRPYSQTPYTPEPGYLLIVREAGSPSSTGLTTSAFRSLGLKAEQFFSAVEGARTGAVEIEGRWYYHDGNSVFPSSALPMCVFLATLEAVEQHSHDRYCGFSAVKSDHSPERAVLEALYAATNGPDWKRNQNWQGELTVHWWRGVTVDRYSGRITHLMLTSNGLRGELPAELGSLDELEVLLLAGNPGLTGCVPSALRGRLKRLTGVEFCGTSPGEAGPVVEQDERPESPDRDVLVALYGATDGENWGSDGNWLSDLHIGEWSGVNVDEHGRVVRLDLARQGLKGEIPPELSELEYLRELNLGHNRLTGDIPPELGGLANLESLYLSGNRLTGEIPPELGNLARLETLYLTSNQLEGQIPPELGGLSELRWLKLDRNRIAGEIPSELSDLHEDADIRLAASYGGNEFTGCLPVLLRHRFASLGLPLCMAASTTTPSPTHEQVRDTLEAFYNATNGPGWRNDWNWLSDAPFGEWAGVYTDGDRVIGLNFRRYGLEGTIPPELADLTDLEFLALPENRLTGPIPPELSSLPRLGALYLFHNRLTGSIPPELSRLSGLTHLELDTNLLTGPIPPELGDLNYLIELGLSGNQLSGTIPKELGRLSNLKQLSISNNQLRGNVPPELGDLTKLERLDLAGNQLTGCIPNSLEGVESNDLAESSLPFC